MSLALICFMMLMPFASSCKRHCQNGWVEYRNHCYKFEDQKISWYKAKRVCNSYGGYLVRIETWSEDEWLQLQATAYDNHVNKGYYIGITDANSEGNWKWESDGEKLTVWNFRKHEPNGGRGENCVLLHTQGKNANPPYKYHDVGCTRKEKFICEKDL